MNRLNSEDFLKFFLCLDILFSTYLYESTRHKAMHKLIKKAAGNDGKYLRLPETELLRRDPF